MESFVEVFGIVFAVALTLLVTTGVALWLDKLATRRRVHSGRAAASERPRGRVAYKRLRMSE